MLLLPLLVAGLLTSMISAFELCSVSRQLVAFITPVAFTPRVRGLGRLHNLCSATTPIRPVWASKKIQEACDASRENSLPVWKMQLSGRQQYYLEQEQRWEREIDAQCPVAVLTSSGLQDTGQKCAQCSGALPTSPLQCGKCSSRSVLYCTLKCHDDAWRTHKFLCSDKVQVKRSAMGDGMGVFALGPFAVGDELIREAPLVVLADSQVCKAPEFSMLCYFISCINFVFSMYAECYV
jgi:hypothetical protein